MPKIILSFCLLLTSCFVYGAETDHVTALLTQAHSKNIAQHPYWKALLHYRTANLDTGIKSEVTSPDFFLAPHGAVNSESELEATLNAFFQAVSEAPDNHAQCRFIARYQWLRKVLDWGGAQPPQVNCLRYQTWIRQGHVNSASLIFATGYLSNPASFYGHILLKFNADRSVVTTNLLDETLNFGAIVPDAEHPLSYIVKGVFGLYDSAFSSTGFYRLNHTYAEEELRDMWEYELNLSPEELQQISAHSWELLQAKFDYYFFNQNCAYRMAELLSLVVDEPLLSPSLPWSVPVSVFDHLVTVQHHGKPLVRSVKRIPSRLNRYRDQYHQLNKNQQQIVGDYVTQKPTLAQTQFSTLGATEQIAIVDTLRDYYQFLLIVDNSNIDYKTRRRDLLIARASLPAMSTAMQEPVQRDNVPPPHSGSPAGMVRLGALQNNKLGAGFSLQLRPTYFDMLQSDSGRLPNAHLSMFDLTATYFSNRWQVRQLNLVNIENLSVSDTPLPHDGGWAWRVKFGGVSAHLACDNCLVANVTGGIGKAVKIGDKIVAYAMLDGMIQSNYASNGTLATQPRLGILATPIEGWKSNLILSRRAYVNGTHSSALQAQWENRFGVARDWDVRLNYSYNVASEWQAALSTYW